MSRDFYVQANEKLRLALLNFNAKLINVHKVRLIALHLVCLAILAFALLIIGRIFI